MHTKFGKVKVGMNFRNIHTKEIFEVVETSHVYGRDVVILNDGTGLNRELLERHYELINQ